MTSPRSTRLVRILCVALLAGGAAACEFDNNPYGPAYRTLHRTIVGAYRPLAELAPERHDLPDNFVRIPPGSDIRLVIGSWNSLTGWIRVPGAAPGGGTLVLRTYGEWEYDPTPRHLTIRVDPTDLTPAFETVLQVTILDSWVRVQGTVHAGGLSLDLDLGKSRLGDEGTGGGGFGPA